ncbi:ABC transporter permease [Propionicimonas sp.]|uniref:ABC transporter permease n=1 Tax=Propionicimonas sp. TaxID=1955623 RepID=UPI001834EA13|nr:ABC transporter permease [Propionicimonas sp.]MBU3977912.1 ABC transporter permease [Actinomycetota bacterium]MBA3021865.1 ABC transporter permease [Propionicimonas sp.]MBU3985356.1 ABC transporter permease [Actinomycetota bacterium]MBU4007411.1 ABC transporter permease [Actinomycetota bacterium]MBU4065643.1 ABC transporter permease [Actinomycetota bacterium]
MSTNVSPVLTEEVSANPVKRLNRGRLTFRRFLRNKTAVVGAAGILFLVLLAVVGPYMLYWRFDDIDPNAFLSPPDSAHLLGTTQAGRDVLALTARGLGKSLLIGFLVAILSTSISAMVGASAAYLGGWYERSMLWIIDLLLVVPSFFLIAIVSRSAPDGDTSWLLLVVLLAAFAWPLSARVVRSLTLSIREREYVLAAKFMGLGAFRIILRHILPNASSLLIIDATLGVGYAILSETGLSYFGFGVHAPDTSLGTLIGEGARMATTYPWVFLGPATVLVFLVLCVNAVGDGLRDALDPNSASGGQA